MSDTELHRSSNHSSDDMNAEVRLAVLEKMVDELNENHRQWYRNPSVLISFVALLASSLSTVYGWYRDIRKDRDEKVAELQMSIQQLHTLTHQWVESYEKYKDSPDYSKFIFPVINKEIALVGTKAYGLLKTIGSEGSALDYATIANALEQTTDYGTAFKALSRGLPNAKTPREYVTVSRMLGQLGYYRNDSSDGDKYFDLAEQVFSLEKFRDLGVNKTDAEYYNAETEAFWAAAAASQKACNLAKSHINNVKQYIGSPSGQVTQYNLVPLIKPAQDACPNA